MRLNNLLATLILLTVLVALGACSKHHDAPLITTTSAPHNVYVLGSSGDTLEYWNNGSPVTLATTSAAGNYLSGMALVNNSVYVTGGGDANPAALFGDVWTSVQNQPVQSSSLLDTADIGSNIHSNGIFVSSTGDVYVAGTVWYNGQTGVPYTTPTAAYPLSGYIATYWKNGAAAQSILVAGSDVYAVGYVDSAASSYAAIWKNGVHRTLSAYPSTANGIAVSGDSVYVAGSENVNGKSYATVWANGLATHLGTGGAAWAVAVQ